MFQYLIMSGNERSPIRNKTAHLFSNTMHGTNTDRISLQLYNSYSELSVNGIFTVWDWTQCTKNRKIDKVTILGAWITELVSEQQRL